MFFLNGKVALITGAARGMGRSHALRFAEQGADIIAVDVGAPVRTSIAPGSTPEELVLLANEIEALGRRVVTAQVDVRDEVAFSQAVRKGVAELGRLDIVIANAGIIPPGRPLEEVPLQEWEDLLSVNLTGAFLTAKIAVPHLKAHGEGGRIILISSALGLRALPLSGPYVSAKHGLVGLMKTLALELAPFRITVNTVHPTNTATPLIQNDNFYRFLRPDLQAPTEADVTPTLEGMSALGIPWIEPEDISEACLYLASSAGRFVTGTALSVDAGFGVK